MKKNINTEKIELDYMLPNIFENKNIITTYKHENNYGELIFSIIEYSFKDSAFFLKTDEDILTTAPFTEKQIYGVYSYIGGKEHEQILEEVRQAAIIPDFITPFNFSALTLEDFTFLKDKQAYNEWVYIFSNNNEGVSEDLIEDYQKGIKMASNLLFERTDFKAGVWKISLNHFYNPHSHNNLKTYALCAAHSFYELFIEIDREKEVIRIMGVYDV